MMVKKKNKVEEVKKPNGIPTEKKLKVHAQRKFAQGSPNFVFLNKERERENGSSNHTSSSAHSDLAASDVPDQCPKTEDFLTFLCFRGTDVLPKSLEYFADPVRHDFPNGVQVVPKSNGSVHSISSKQEKNSKGVEGKQQEASAVATIPKSQMVKLKKNQPINKSKISISRIHSSFRRTMTSTSRILTRMSRSKTSSDLPTTKFSNNKVAKKKKDSKSLPVRVATRSQRRNAPQQASSSESCSSSKSSSDSDSTSSSEEEQEPPPVPSKGKAHGKAPLVKKSAVQSKPLAKKIVNNVSVSKNTRLSAVKSTPIHSPIKKPENNSSVNLRRKPGSASSSRMSSPVKSNLKATPQAAAEVSPKKITREVAKKLGNDSSNNTSSPADNNRRPSRRTKVAAKFYMTLMGQEDALDSSELEELAAQIEKADAESNAKKKTQTAKSGKKRETAPPSPPGVRTTRRGVIASPATASPQTKNKTILREAAKRFSSAQSSDSSESESSDSSSEEENSSSSEEDTPARSLRNRSSKPSSTQLKVPVGIVRLPDIEIPRQTRASLTNKKRESNTTIPKSKTPTPVDAKKVAPKGKVTNVKDNAAKRKVVTPLLDYDLSSLVEAPIFRPSEKEFLDPMEYLEKIRVECEPFGICRIIPPASFKPECQLSDSMRFTAYNQYIHRTFRRYGPNSRQLEAIRLHLDSLNIDCRSLPCIGGVEIDLPGLYDAVEELGGLGPVLESNMWAKVADKLKMPRTAQDRVSKLDSIYCKYLLPYATLSDDERKKLLQKVDLKNSRRSNKDDEEDECVVKGSSLALSNFYRIARNTMSVWFPHTVGPSSADSVPYVEPEQVEANYWKIVTERKAHVCVHSGNIDSGNAGYGFPCNKTSRHPWNLKVLTNNNGSILRSLGPVPGCTAPTLHVGMMFSASFWYRDPHGLPWIDYLHTGADKIWYGVPSLQEPVLRRAMTKLVPDLVNGEDKSVWLSSDTVMVPPTMLADEGVTLSRTVQQSGQFIVVWPQAFSSSLSTGYTVSESVYFAPLEWLPIGDACFKELRDNSEPTVFSFHELLWNIVHDSRSTANVLKSVVPLLQPAIQDELRLRSSLRNFGVQQWQKIQRPDDSNQRTAGDNRKRRRQSISQDEGEMECDLCRTSLFFSRVEYHPNKSDSVTWCLLHALRKVKERSKLSQLVKVFYVHEDEELRQTLNNSEDNARSKTVRKTVTQHQRSSTL